MENPEVGKHLTAMPSTLQITEHKVKLEKNKEQWETSHLTVQLCKEQFKTRKASRVAEFLSHPHYQKTLCLLWCMHIIHDNRVYIETFRVQNVLLLCPVFSHRRSPIAQDLIGWGPGQPYVVCDLVVSIPTHDRVELDDHWGSSQPKPFCDSTIQWFYDPESPQTDVNVAKGKMWSSVSSNE